MAPEQMLGERAGPAADIYEIAAGVPLHESLTLASAIVASDSSPSSRRADSARHHHDRAPHRSPPVAPAPPRHRDRQPPAATYRIPSASLPGADLDGRRAVGAPLPATHLPDAVRAALPDLAPPAERDSGLLEVIPVEAPAATPPVPDRDALLALVIEHRGNVAAIARSLRRDRALIHRWLKRHGIEPAAYRDGQ